MCVRFVTIFFLLEMKLIFYFVEGKFAIWNDKERKKIGGIYKLKIKLEN